METFSAQLAIYAGNSPVPGEFPTQRPVTRNFDVFFDLRLNNDWVNNGEAGDLIRHRAHYDVSVMKLPVWLVPSHCLQLQVPYITDWCKPMALWLQSN